MFRTLRYFSLTSLGTFLVAAILLVTLYRGVAIGGIVHLGEEKNVNLAQTALNSMHDELISYLDRASTGNVKLDDPHAVALARQLDRIMQGTTVVRVKLMDSRGVVIYSTKKEQIGHNENTNAGYEAAIAGKVASNLIYRDSFNAFDKTTGDENLIQTYLPVRKSEDTPVLGVFELYADVSSLVYQAERTQVIMVLGAISIMGLAYLALLFFVRRADQIMETQRQTIFDRTRALEMVSAQLFIGQEKERKRVAGDLHEGLAQSLAGIKLQLDSALMEMAKNRGRGDLSALDSAVDELAKVIDHTRSLAMELRPASLDDLGLVDTLAWHLKQLAQSYPAVSISSQLEIEESDIPPHLKTGIYRVVEEILDPMVRQPQVSSVAIRLGRSRNELKLLVSDTGQPYRPGGRSAPRDDVSTAAARERVLLSGGTFSVETTPWGAVRISATWPLLEEPNQARA